MIADYGETFENCNPKKGQQYYSTSLQYGTNTCSIYDFFWYQVLLLSFVLERLQDDLQSQGDML